MHSAKKIGKISDPVDTPRGSCFAKALHTLQKSGIQTFGKVFANADYVRLTSVIISVYLWAINCGKGRRWEQAPQRREF